MARILLLSSALLLLTSEARAETYFVCDCGPGAQPGCVGGSDASTGITAALPFQTYEKARETFGVLAPGDEILFCRGGSFAITGSTQWSNASCTAGSPCSVGAYVPTWGSAALPRPIITYTGADSAVNFSDGGEAEHEEGYRFSELDVRCTMDAFGFFFYSDIDDVILDNVAVSGCAVGVHIADGQPCGPDPLCNGRNDRITLRNSQITNNSASGFLGGSDDLVVEGNYFADNGSGTVFGHNVYVSNGNGTTHRGRVRFNTLYRSSIDGEGDCNGGSFVAHGVHEDLLIEGNVVYEDVGAAKETCWGIGVNSAYSTAEAFPRLVIRGNTVRNVGNLAISVNACVACVIENNVVVSGQPFGAVAIAAPGLVAGVEDETLDDLTVRNNTLYLTGSGGAGVRIGNEGNGHVIVSNAVLYEGSGLDGFACFNFTAAGSVSSDYNLCSLSAGEFELGAGNIIAWRAWSGGQDTHSTDAAPDFADASHGDFLPASGASPLVSAGDPTRSAVSDLRGATRDGTPDIGAYELGGAVPADAGVAPGLDGGFPPDDDTSQTRGRCCTCAQASHAEAPTWLLAAYGLLVLARRRKR